MLSKNQYLNLIGIPQWKLRPQPVELVTVKVCPSAQWLFILEKQEVELDSALFDAILAAIGQTKDTVNIAYYDEAPISTMTQWPELRYIVAMGSMPSQQLQTNRHLFMKDVFIMTSDNLLNLAKDTIAKRQLWQQLKLHLT